jgi:hypothetical protein
VAGFFGFTDPVEVAVEPVAVLDVEEPVLPVVVAIAVVLDAAATAEELE